MKLPSAQERASIAAFRSTGWSCHGASNLTRHFRSMFQRSLLLKSWTATAGAS